VYLRAKEINLSIVRDGELLENIFFVFSKKSWMEKRDGELFSCYIFKSNRFYCGTLNPTAIYSVRANN